jgi:hypothetical protein
MVATMHFVPPTSHWLPSVEPKLKYCTWLEFASMLLDRFGRDQHELLVRQLLHVRQSGTVADYIDKFVVLIDQLAAYEGAGNPLHYTMRFIDDLKDELKAADIIQRPKDLDTTYILAQLQEEVLDVGKKKEFKRPDYPSRTFFKSATSGQPYSTKQGKNIGAPADDKRAIDPVKIPYVEDRWKSLRAF